jgi:hypothetical protein
MVARTSVLLVAGLLVGAAGCSGASSSDIPSPTSTSLPSTPSPGATSGSTATGPGAAATAGGNGSPVATPGPGGTLPPTLPGSVPSTNPACVVALNDDAPDQATMFTSCVTGTLGADRQSQYVQIVVPDGARHMTVSHQETGTVVYRLGAAGDPLSIVDSTTLGDGSTDIRVMSGATYMFRVIAGNGGGGPRSYELDVAFSGSQH